MHSLLETSHLFAVSCSHFLLLLQDTAPPLDALCRDRTVSAWLAPGALHLPDRTTGAGLPRHRHAATTTAGLREGHSAGRRMNQVKITIFPPLRTYLSPAASILPPHLLGHSSDKLTVHEGQYEGQFSLHIFGQALSRISSLESFQSWDMLLACSMI